MLVFKTKPDGKREYVDQVESIGNNDYVADGNIYKNAMASAILVGSESDLDLLTNYEPGSIAYTAGFDSMWQLGVDGEWVEI